MTSGTKRPRIIGITGCTNGGKTTLSKKLLAKYDRSCYLQQDEFYYPRDTDHLEYINDLESFNFDVITAINMDKFRLTLAKLIESGTCDYIFLDGFLLFEDAQVYQMLDRRYFLHLEKEECLRRRVSRNYKSIDTPNYFDRCVWVEFLKYKQMCESKYIDIVYLNGAQSAESIFDLVCTDLTRLEEELTTMTTTAQQPQ